MSTTANQTITVKTTVNKPVEKVWKSYNSPEHITQWNSPSEDWHSPKASNDLRKGGKFSIRMEAKDGSYGFDFAGTYDEVRNHELITYTMDDNRKVSITFSSKGNTTDVVTKFDPESENSIEMQQSGWQAILDSFKKYTETATI